MAGLRILLTTEQSDPEPFDALQHPVDALQEQRALRESSVEDIPLGVVVLLAIRPPPELLTEKQVADACSLHGLPEWCLIEVRRVRGPRERPDVHEDLNAVGLEEVQQFVQGMVRVPDGEQAASHGRLGLMPSLQGNDRARALQGPWGVGGLLARLLSGSDGFVHAAASMRLSVVGVENPRQVDPTVGAGHRFAPHPGSVDGLKPGRQPEGHREGHASAASSSAPPAAPPGGELPPPPRPR